MKYADILIDSLSGGGAVKLLSDLLPILKYKYKIVCNVLLLTDKNDKYSLGLQEAGFQSV